MKQISESIEITAPVEAVFAVVSDLPGMGAFSPENTGGTWVGRHRSPALGAKFKGTNGRGAKHWTTMAKVTEYDEPHRFTFRVTGGGFKVATWSYELEPIDQGTRLTESWSDDRSAFFKRMTRSVSDVRDRGEFTKTSIRETLAAIKRHVEGATQ